ncbi:hypothetical protein T552_04113 [Pneumocystis carinii B80]|uniref:2,3-diketo-5-methylthio-1-phosphopentane phosphatase n=1 Tax=Pneumocystis carinii (strain B80) TaxID=1408658 RepID=A0A0W4ZM34_PNEC8|nr:hypothetical protein T552_04113 [Pneumocystis carinii B80]KTW29412.1 hypothetical protein T552_04113 [Pneumocystis carinii B80]
MHEMNKSFPGNKDLDKNKQDLFVFCDFDGTIAIQDSGKILFDRYGCSPEKQEKLEEVLRRGERSFRDISEELWGYLKLSLSEGIDIVVQELEVDPGFYNFYNFCLNSSIPFWIISSGLYPLLKASLSKFLGAEMAEHIKIISNDVEVNPEGIWKPIWRDDTPFGHDKAASIKNCIKNYSNNESKELSPVIIFIGDGVSDFSVVNSVDILFARKGFSLEKYCLEHSIPYISYETFDDVQREITAILYNSYQYTPIIEPATLEPVCSNFLQVPKTPALN